MAKKKIGDIAEAHDLNPKEVVKQLQEAGFSVQNQRSTIDENLALKVLKVGQATAAGNGDGQTDRPTRQTSRKVQPAGSQPRPHERRPPRDHQPQGGRGPQGAGGRGGGRPQVQAPDRGGRPQGQGGGQRQAGGAGGGQRQGGAGGGGGGQRGQRPTRDDQRTGERAPNAGGGPRRVVIDSQASRRQGGGPPPQVPRRPVRRSRRRRGTFDETIQPLDTAAQSRTDTVKVNSGSTVKDIAEYFGVPVPDIIKKLMTLGEMATLTHTLSDEAIGVL